MTETYELRIFLAATFVFGVIGAIAAATGAGNIEQRLGPLARYLVPVWCALFSTVAVLGFRMAPQGVHYTRTIKLLLNTMFGIWIVVVASMLFG